MKYLRISIIIGIVFLLVKSMFFTGWSKFDSLANITLGLASLIIGFYDFRNKTRQNNK